MCSKYIPCSVHVGICNHWNLEVTKTTKYKLYQLKNILVLGIQLGSICVEIYLYFFGTASPGVGFSKSHIIYIAHVINILRIIILYRAYVLLKIYNMIGQLFTFFGIMHNIHTSGLGYNTYYVNYIYINGEGSFFEVLQNNKI